MLQTLGCRAFPGAQALAGLSTLVSVRLLKEIGECSMIDPLNAARQLLTLVDREIRIARRVVVFHVHVRHLPD